MGRLEVPRDDLDGGFACARGADRGADLVLGARDGADLVLGASDGADLVRGARDGADLVLGAREGADRVLEPLDGADLVLGAREGADRVLPRDGAAERVVGVLDGADRAVGVRVGARRVDGALPGVALVPERPVLPELARGDEERVVRGRTTGLRDGSREDCRERVDVSPERVDGRTPSSVGVDGRRDPAPCLGVAARVPVRPVRRPEGRPAAKVPPARRGGATAAPPGRAVLVPGRAAAGTLEGRARLPVSVPARAGVCAGVAAVVVVPRRRAPARPVAVRGFSL
ncbi:MAG: hypothetical protein MK486_10730 [Gemmatimonadetes bacterium]|nr:hypothetical protein [Gemmatimonadota bacterium]